MKTIFEFERYRDYLKYLIEEARTRGESLRSLTRRLGMSNPNYLPQVISSKRNLTHESAQKIALGLGLKSEESRYLLALVSLEQDPSSSEEIRGTLTNLAKAAQKKVVTDNSRYNHWLYSLIRELSVLDSFDFTATNIYKFLWHLASEQEIKEGIEFVKSKKWVESTGKGEQFRPTDIRFAPSDDLRHVLIQATHERFLDLAKHRLRDPVTEREYQGLTVAIPEAKIPKLKKMIREFYDELELCLEDQSKADTVVRIQTAMFKVLAPSKKS